MTAYSLPIPIDSKPFWLSALWQYPVSADTADLIPLFESNRLVPMISVRGVPAIAVPLLFKRHNFNAVKHVFLCIADHFEPGWRGADGSTRRARVLQWTKEYPIRFRAKRDCIGRPPRHTFFYPAEEYDSDCLDLLADLCSQGFGDVEVHLHHQEDTPQRFKTTLEVFLGQLDKHGLLRRDNSGRATYGFVHGNWALNNSHPQGLHCGVNDETSILLGTGCYADFTMPSAPAVCQTTTINSIYYAAPNQNRPKAHDRGTRAEAGKPAPEGHLLLIQGPLTADWRNRRMGFLPSLENGDLHGGRVPTIDRFKRWLKAGVHVRGRPDWLFVKIHTHGAQEKNSAILLGEPMVRFHDELAQWQADNPMCHYYYVTARELAELVHQAESGVTEPVLSRK